MTQLADFLNVFNPIFILPIVLIKAVVIMLFFRRQMNQEPNLIKRGLHWFKLNLILLSIFIVIAGTISFLLNRTLDSVGYPANVSDLQTTEQILAYLQRYNRAITTNTYALIWFLYAFVIWFLTSLYAFAQVFTETLLRQSSK